MPHDEKNEHKTLPWTLNNTSCSCLICDSIWLFSRICFSFPQGSQPFAASAFMVSTCFKHQLHAFTLTWNLSFCNTQEQPRHMSSVAACSSAGASASARSSEAGAWQRVFTAQMPSWVSCDSISTRNPQSIHLHKSRRISSHVHKTKTRNSQNSGKIW